MEFFGKRVLITGGTGYLGTYLANYLFSKGFSVRIFDLLECRDNDYTGKVEFVKGDVRNYDLLSDATKEVDYVVHAAAAAPYRDSRTIYSIAIQGTLNIFKASEKNGVDRVVYISSTAVYGFQKEMPIKETAPCLGVGSHAESKKIAENICASYRKDGMVVPVLRPRPLVGAGRLGVFQILFDWIKDNKRIPVIGAGTNKCQLLDSEDLVEAILLSIVSSKDKANDVFNLGNEKFASLNEDLAELIKEVNSKSRLVHFPASPVKFMLKIFEKFSLSPLYEGAYGIIDKNLNVSVDKIKQQLGWSSNRSNAESLIRAYNWFQKHCHELGRESGKTNKGVFEQGVLNIIKKVF
ncbi:MAG: NAD(P)-dependent oxidoreductase [Candidatus Omnitrophota bacterium]